MNRFPVSLFTPLEKILLVFAGVLMLAGSGATYLWHRAQGQTRAAALHADSLAAALDVSHRVALSSKDSNRILGDSLQAVGRRAFQVPQKNDALDKALELDRKAIATLTAQVKALEVTIASSQPVTTDPATGARSASFPIAPDTTHPEKPPYSGAANVSLPQAGRGTLDLSLSLPPASIGLRLGCGAKRDGIRSASATLTGPPWLQLALGRVEQDPEICNSTASRPGFFRRLLSACGVGPGYSLVFAGGKWVGGPGAVATCHAWP